MIPAQKLKIWIRRQKLHILSLNCPDSAKGRFWVYFLGPVPKNDALDVSFVIRVVIRSQKVTRGKKIPRKLKFQTLIKYGKLCNKYDKSYNKMMFLKSAFQEKVRGHQRLSEHTNLEYSTAHE